MIEEERIAPLMTEEMMNMVCEALTDNIFREYISGNIVFSVIYRDAISLPEVGSDVVVKKKKREELKHLSKYRQIKKNDPLIGKTCTICFCEFKEGEYKRELDKCKNHVFHKKCIDSWLITNMSCPICRISYEKC